jgi:hypothetical protein
VREGIQVIRLPPRSRNLNAFAERFVRSIKEECLSRMIFFGPASLQHAVRQFMAHYHSERNHQGLHNRLPRPASVTALPHHPVRRASASAECSATTIGPQPDEGRWIFLDNSRLNGNALICRFISLDDRDHHGLRFAMRTLMRVPAPGRLSYLRRSHPRADACRSARSLRSRSARERAPFQHRRQRRPAGSPTCW